MTQVGPNLRNRWAHGNDGSGFRGNRIKKAISSTEISPSPYNRYAFIIVTQFIDN